MTYSLGMLCDVCGTRMEWDRPAIERGEVRSCRCRGTHVQARIVDGRATLRLMPVLAAYCDGGTIGKNPSYAGGTYAWLHVGPDRVVLKRDSGTLIPDPGLPVTNNQAEFYAMLAALEALPDDWRGVVHSDSNVTLGRFGKLWSTVGIRGEWLDRMERIHRRMDRKKIKWVLLDGHPTAGQLARGTGKRGHPVDALQVWCDSECSRLAGRGA
jgi:ribonuclease HI